MGAPVLLMGASFPFVQAVVARRLDTLGRRTGTLLFANICGNVAGGAMTGFVLLDRLGTAGRCGCSAGVLLLPGLARRRGWRRRAAASRPRSARRPRRRGRRRFPSNERFWAFFHSTPLERFELAEDRACVNSLVDAARRPSSTSTASWQNGHPYDLFHILIGLLPSLMHDRAGAGPRGRSRHRLDRLLDGPGPAPRARRLRRDLRRREAADRRSASAARSPAGACSTTRASGSSTATAAAGSSARASRTT